MPRNRPTGYPSNEQTETITRFGPNPVSAFMVGVLDRVLGMGLAGEIGHITIGDKQGLKTAANLAPAQEFVGAAQLTNLANARQSLGTAMPATKPNPGAIPLTQMQQQLAALAGN